MGLLAIGKPHSVIVSQAENAPAIRIISDDVPVTILVYGFYLPGWS